MNLISHILPSTHVTVGFEARDKLVVFEHAAAFFASEYGLVHKQIVNALAQREKLGSTALGQGVAIPHGRIKGLKESIGVFVRTAESIPFGAPDDKPVNLIFIMLVPEQANESHLNLLSELAQMFSDRAFREDLALAPDAAQVHRLFTEWTPHAANERRFPL